MRTQTAPSRTHGTRVSPARPGALHTMAAPAAILLGATVANAALVYQNNFDNTSGVDVAFQTVDWDYIYNDSGNSYNGDETVADPFETVISANNGSSGSPGYIFLSSGMGWRFFQEEVLVYSTDMTPYDYSSIDTVSFYLRNSSSSDGLAAALKIDGTWYVSDNHYSATSWTNFAIDPNMDTNWSELNVAVGSAPLSVAGGTSGSLPASGTLEAVGLYVAETIPISGMIRIDTVSVEATPDGSGGPTEIIGVTASSHDGNVPANTLDGDTGTRWSALGSGEWIAFELNTTAPVAGLNIAFYKGDQRAAYFDIETSTNGQNWTQVYSGQSSGTTNGLQAFNFTATNALYVRYVGDGNSVNGWNSITEVELILPGAADTQAPSAPTNLSATAISSSQINLGWTASTDNVGVAGYDIYRGGSYLDTTTSTSYADSGLSPNTNYGYSVKAFDAASNVSNASNGANATTQQAPGGAPTHPYQTGLAGAGVTRNNLPVSPTLRFDSSDNGSTITDLAFNGTVILDNVDGITFKRCWFMGSTWYSLRGMNGTTDVTVEDSDFGDHGSGNFVGASHTTGLGGTTYLTRCLFYNSADSIKLSNNSVTFLEQCWLQPVNLPGGHTDCMQANDNVAATVYAYQSTFETRTFKFNGVVAQSQEELSAGTVTVSNIASWGNAVLQTKPCGSGGCSGPVTGAYYSFEECLMTGGNYIMTADVQSGEFINNTVIRDAANPATDLGLRNASNITISGNVFHDNGATYSGGALGSGENPTPIPDLGL